MSEHGQTRSDYLVLVPTRTAVPNFTITADVEDGLAVLTHDVEAYVPIDAAIVGSWNEVARLDCPDYAGSTPPEQLAPEMVFYNSGDFFLAWNVLESN